MTQQKLRILSVSDKSFLEEVFNQCRLVEEGVSLTEFLDNPWQILAKFGQEDAPRSIVAGFLPLLPTQAKTAFQLQAEENMALCYPQQVNLIH